MEPIVNRTAIDTALERRDTAISAARQLLDDHPDGLPDDVQTRYDKYVATAEDAAKQATSMRALSDLIDSGQASFTAGEDTGPAHRRNSRRTTDTSTPEYRALSAIDATPGVSTEQRELGERLVRKDPTGGAARWAAAAADPNYLRAFAALAADPDRGHLLWSSAEQEAFAVAQHEARAMALTDANGGFMVPFALDPAIMLTGDGSVDPIRAAARVVTTASDSWNGVSSAGVTTRWAEEASEANDDSPTLAQPSVPVHRADSFVPYSFEVGGDALGLVAELGRIMLDAARQHEAAAWINGNGTTQPQGIITGMVASAIDDVAPAVAETFGSEDVYKTLEALPPRFREDARWFAELSTMNLIDQFESGAGSLLFPGVGATNPVLLRRRLYEASEIDAAADIDPAATADNRILIVGDLARGYVIADRAGATVELVPHLFGVNNRPTGQRGLFMHWRVGAAVVVPEAIRVLNIATVA